MRASCRLCDYTYASMHFKFNRFERNGYIYPGYTVFLSHLANEHPEEYERVTTAFDTMVKNFVEVTKYASPQTDESIVP